MTKQYSDQIAYRAAHYVNELGKRDDSPSKAARFAAIRYLDLMERAKKHLKSYFDDKDLETILKIAQTVDWTHPDNYDTFWARVELAGYKDLSALVKPLGTVLIDGIVDMARMAQHDNPY